jgi:hypothetical protein
VIGMGLIIKKQDDVSKQKKDEKQEYLDSIFRKQIEVRKI